MTIIGQDLSRSAHGDVVGTVVDLRSSDPGESLHVFADPSGSRRRAFKVALLATLAFIAIILTLALPPVLSPLRPEPDVRVGLVDTGLSPPVVGVGPFVRVVRTRLAPDGLMTSDAFTGGTAGLLTGHDVELAGDSPFVIQRYGYEGATGKTISLTFEEGPSRNTEELLGVLARNEIPATLFVSSSLAIRQEGAIEKALDAGHVVAPETVTYVHMNAPTPREQFELTVGDRVLRGLTGQGAGFTRLPFMKAFLEDPDYVHRLLPGVLAAQRLGYTVVGFDQYVSTESLAAGTWDMPRLNRDHLVLRLPDSMSTDWERTAEYIDQLAPYVRAQGYEFTTLPQAFPALAGSYGPISITFGDKVALAGARISFRWVGWLGFGLFIFALVAVFVVSMLNAVLAVRRTVRRRERLRIQEGYLADAPRPRVTVLLAAYNEEVVIARTLRSILRSEYPLAEVLVVDDGSQDETAARALDVAREDGRVRVYCQRNTGKSGALNKGLREAVGEIVVTVDADTIVAPDMVTNLLRHFQLDTRGRLAAVAGFVRVGNRAQNLITRWQALEYITQICVDRAAQDHFNAISIIPGACAAWRRAAVLEVGGFSEDTLAEDCDLCLSLHRGGWGVTQDDDAVALTEAPDSADALLTQRSRWMFGTMQAVFKNRDMVLCRRYGWLGMFVLPWYVLSLVVPLLTLPLLVVLGLTTWRTEGMGLIALFFLIFTIAHGVVAAVGVWLSREEWSNLLMVPMYRLIFEPLRAYLLYTAAWRALSGRRAGWNKLRRTGLLDTAVESSGQARAGVS